MREKAENLEEFEKKKTSRKFGNSGKAVKDANGLLEDEGGI